jgi:hypothetical protein
MLKTSLCHLKIVKKHKQEQYTECEYLLDLTPVISSSPTHNGFRGSQIQEEIEILNAKNPLKALWEINKQLYSSCLTIYELKYAYLTKKFLHFGSQAKLKVKFVKAKLLSRAELMSLSRNNDSKSHEDSTSS